MAFSGQITDAASFQTVFNVSRETLLKLETYAALMRRWQPTINLVAPSTVPDIWHRHFADSAQIFQLLPDLALMAQAGGPHWLDLGSGAGFPGLVVGIMMAERGFGRLTLIESDQRKAAFLREVVRETGLGRSMLVDIVVGRIESPANHTKVGQVDVVSARALAPLPKLLGWAEPYFGAQTHGLLLKGRDAGLEVEAASALPGWQFRLEASVTDVEARIVVVTRAV
jgi:16S rRNA (guanine527-N7)-methyltransferase